MEQEQYTPSEGMKVSERVERPDEKSDKAILAEAERIEAREAKIYDARERGEKVERPSQTLQERITEQIIMYKAYGILYGKEALAERLGYNMDAFVEQIKGDTSTQTGRDYGASYKEAINAMLPDIQKDPKLHAIYGEAKQEYKQYRSDVHKAFDLGLYIRQSPEKQKRMLKILDALSKHLWKYQKQAKPDFSKTSLVLYPCFPTS